LLVLTIIKEVNYLKKIIGSLFVFVMLFGVVGTASAIAFPNEDNPNLVAYYTTGPHGIPGVAEHHEGMDAVLRLGSNGNFQQWFFGTSESEGLHGHHTVWKIEGPNGCANGWLLVPTPYPEWGDYLTPGVNYCVKTNDY
jgi:hypothetical protein